MGTDIRFFVEFKAPGSASADWEGLAEFHPYRDSELIFDFCQLIDGRGLPKDYSIRFFERAFVYIAPEEEITECVGGKFCTEELAQRWVTDGSQIYKSERTDAAWVLDPEFKYAGWVSFSEFEEVFIVNSESRNSSIEYETLHCVMRNAEARFGPGTVRAIVWSC